MTVNTRYMQATPNQTVRMWHSQSVAGILQDSKTWCNFWYCTFCFDSTRHFWWVQMFSMCLCGHNTEYTATSLCPGYGMQSLTTHSACCAVLHVADRLKSLWWWDGDKQNSYMMQGDPLTVNVTGVLKQTSHWCMTQSGWLRDKAHQQRSK